MFSKALLMKYASEDKTLYENDWLSLKETNDGYIYSYESRSDGKLVAVLGFKSDGKYLGRYERNPAHKDDIALCALTGGVDKDVKDIKDMALQELEEESGIKADKDELIDLGTVRPSKSADTTFYLFGINLDDYEIGEAKGDGSKGEEGSYCKWVSKDDLINCKDPIVHVMILRLDNK